MKKITPIALIVTGGLSAQAANAAIITQTFNVTPTTNGVDVTIGAASGPQYTYTHVVKPIPVDPGAIVYDSLAGTSANSMFATVSGEHVMPTAQSSFGTSPFKPSPGGNDYVGLKFNIGTGAHYGIAHFGAPDIDGAVPLADVEYNDVAIAAAVPEPASWVMLIGGLGVAGVAMRRSRRRSALATA